MCIFGWFDQIRILLGFDANGDVGDAHFCKETSQRTPKKRNTYVLDAANALKGYLLTSNDVTATGSPSSGFYFNHNVVMKGCVIHFR